MPPLVTPCTTEAHWQAVYDLLCQLYPDKARADIAAQAEEMRQDRWHGIGVFDDPTGPTRCLASVLYRIGRRLYSGKYIRMDSMVIDAACRSQGHGKALMDWCAAKGTAEACERLILDSYVDNFRAHRFFYREGGEIRGYHFNRPL